MSSRANIHWDGLYPQTLSCRDSFRNPRHHFWQYWCPPNLLYCIENDRTSGLDVYFWWRRHTAFKKASSSLCQSLADVYKCLCSYYVDPDAISSLLACRMIALDKCPGVWPIRIGDTACRIIARAVLSVVKSDIQDAAGAMLVRFQNVKQLCIQWEHFLEATTEAFCWWMPQLDDCSVQCQTFVLISLYYLD